MKHSRLLIGLAVLVTVVVLAVQFVDPAALREHVEMKTLDLRFYLRGLIRRPTPPNDIVIVTIDEKSIAAVGRWPWGRATMGRLVDGISAAEPRVVAVDIFFTEEEKNSTNRLLKAALKEVGHIDPLIVKAIRKAGDTDSLLAAALKRAGNVVLASPFFLKEEESARRAEETEFLWDHAFLVVRGTKEFDWKQFVAQAEAAMPPLEVFASASTLGHVYSQPDRDGVLRQETLYLHYDGEFYPSLALQATRLALGLEPEDMELLGGTGVKLGQRLIQSDLNGKALINYIGREGSFPYISASDVLSGAVPASAFKEKIVLVGTSALATYDQKITPLSANMPGVEKNANVINNILTGNFIKPTHRVLEMVVTFLLGTLLSVFLFRMKALQGTMLSLSMIFAYAAFTVFLFTYAGVWINLIYPASNLLFIFIGQVTLKYFGEEKKSREIRDMFKSYVSPKIVSELMANPEKARLGGVRKTVTVLFSDVIGFTSLSETREPEAVLATLNEYLGEMSKIIFKWEGTLDKFVGDEIMAFWGAPAEQPDHAELALRCSLNMFHKLGELQAKWKKEDKPILDCGVGLNSGEVLVGNIGAEGLKMDYTIIGDHVNTGARVEGLTRQFKTKILITEATKQYLKHVNFGHTVFEPCEPVKVKGKELPLQVYKVYESED